MDFINRIEIIHNSEYDKLGREGKHTITMEVCDVDGNIFKKYLQYAKGSHVHPLTEEELFRKFRQLSEKVFTKEKTQKIFDTIMEIEGLNDITIFSDMLKS